MEKRKIVRVNKTAVQQYQALMRKIAREGSEKIGKAFEVYRASRDSLMSSGLSEEELVPKINNLVADYNKQISDIQAEYREYSSYPEKYIMNIEKN